MIINRNIKKLGTLIEVLHEHIDLKQNYIAVYEMQHAYGTIIEVKSNFNNFMFIRIVFIPGQIYNVEIPDNILKPQPLPVVSSFLYQR